MSVTIFQTVLLLAFTWLLASGAPFLFQGVSFKRSFDISLKPLHFRPLTFIKEKWSPLGVIGRKHSILRRDLSGAQEAALPLPSTPGVYVPAAPVFEEAEPMTSAPLYVQPVTEQVVTQNVLEILSESVPPVDSKETVHSSEPPPLIETNPPVVNPPSPEMPVPATPIPPTPAVVTPGIAETPALEPHSTLVNEETHPAPSIIVIAPAPTVDSAPLPPPSPAGVTPIPQDISPPYHHYEPVPVQLVPLMEPVTQTQIVTPPQPVPLPKPPVQSIPVLPSGSSSSPIFSITPPLISPVPNPTIISPVVATPLPPVPMIVPPGIANLPASPPQLIPLAVAEPSIPGSVVLPPAPGPVLGPVSSSGSAVIAPVFTQPPIGLVPLPPRENGPRSLLTDIYRITPDVFSSQLGQMTPPLETNTINIETPRIQNESNFMRRSKLALHFGNILFKLMSQFFTNARLTLDQLSSPPPIYQK